MEDKRIVQNLIDIAYIHLFFSICKEPEQLFQKRVLEVEMSSNIMFQCSYDVDFEKESEGIAKWEIQLLYKKHYPIFSFSALVEERPYLLYDYFYAGKAIAKEENGFIESLLQKKRIVSYKVRPTKKTIDDLEFVITYYLNQLKEVATNEEKQRNRKVK